MLTFESASTLGAPAIADKLTVGTGLESLKTVREIDLAT